MPCTCNKRILWLIYQFAQGNKQAHAKNEQIVIGHTQRGSTDAKCHESQLEHTGEVNSPFKLLSSAGRMHDTG